VIDAFSRRVVGWSMAAHLRTELVLDAFNMAVWNRRPGEGLVHHSDHGCQYTSLAFGRRLREAGIVGSMGTVGDCFDNAAAESFFATLKTELLSRHSWATRAEATTAIFDYIEGFYNRRRHHSTLDYQSPADYEHHHVTASAVA
jgi:putative transposase